MKRICILLPFFALFLLVGCCSSGTEAYETQIFSMDTVITITASGGDTQAALTAAGTEIKRLEALFSVTDENSEISAINCGAGEPVTVSGETADIISRALSYSEQTDGRFDIGIYPVLRAWGFTVGEYRIPDDTEIQELLKNTGYQNITVQGDQVTIGQGMEIDVGGIAKGYAGDTVREIFADHGVNSAIINLGGDVQLIGSNTDGSPWRVAIQDPDSDDYLGVIAASDLAVATSGSYERYFTGEDDTRYHHIIDPATGAPAESGLDSVTIITESGTDADALATSLFIMGVDGAADFWRETGGFEALMVSDAGEIFVTGGMKNMFELTEENADRAITILEK